MMIGGRRVFLNTGEKTQTVRVCDANNRRGDYEWIIRTFAPVRVTEAEVAAQSNVNDLITWLKNIKRGKVEKEPLPEAGATREALPRPEEENTWIEIAVVVVEQAIDQLVQEFLRAPYLHRVEHSLHARLFANLAVHDLFRGEIPLSNAPYVTQPIHKEWPETIPQENCRRGNFDLAILPPHALNSCSIDDFRAGRIAAPIVIEMGLDYGAAHLAEDAEKLINSEVPHGYLVHFTRKTTDEQTEKTIRDPGGFGRIHTAFASVHPRPRYKFVRGKEIVEHTLPLCASGAEV